MFFACCFMALFFLCQGQSRPVMIDQWVMDFINNIQLPFLEKISLFFSFVGGELIFLWTAVVAAILFFGVKKSELSIYFLGANVVAAVLTIVAKFFGSRARPLEDITLSNQHSYPSGHTVCSLVFFGLLYWVTPVLTKNKYWQTAIRIFCIVAMLIVPFSRVHLQWHYPTDVLGGFCLGAAALMGTIFVYRIFSKGDTLNA
jgi:undecaprenyl-diphosphatase